MVLDVLSAQGEAPSRQSLGISVPVPVESEQVISALVSSSVLLRGLESGTTVQALALEDESVSRLHEAWDQMADKREPVAGLLCPTGNRA